MMNWPVDPVLDCRVLTGILGADMSDNALKNIFCPRVHHRCRPGGLEIKSSKIL